MVQTQIQIATPDIRFSYHPFLACPNCKNMTLRVDVVQATKENKLKKNKTIMVCDSCGKDMSGNRDKWVSK